MTNYSIDDATGTLLCAGLQGDVVAYRTAQRLANERGELVRLYESDALSEDEGGPAAEIIHPDVEDVAEASQIKSPGHTYTYTLIENGYAYETGTLEAADIDTALDMAADLAKPGARETYMPDDGSTITVTHGVQVTDGEETRKTTRDFDVE